MALRGISGVVSAESITGVLPVAHGGTGGTSLSAVFVGRKGQMLAQLSGGGGTLANGTYWLSLSAPVGCTINSLTAKTSSGTFTANVQINGVSVTGLSAVAVTSSVVTTNATAANTVAVGNVITLIVTLASSPLDAVVQINFTQT